MMMKWSAPVWALGLMLAGGCPLSVDDEGAQGDPNVDGEPEHGDGMPGDGESDAMDSVDDEFVEPGDDELVEPGDDHEDEASSDDDADAGTDPDVDAGAPIDCGGEPCGTVRCDEQHLGFPATTRMRGWVSSLVPVEALRWTLQSKPAGSVLETSGSEASSFDFEPDVEGTYVWCVSATNVDLGESCCEVTSWADDFAYQGPFPEVMTVEELEMQGGVFSVTFGTAMADNEPVTPDFDSVRYMLNGTPIDSFDATGEYSGLNFSTSVLLAEVNGDQVLASKDLVHVGDVMDVSLDVTLATGSKRTVQGTVAFVPEAVDADAPVITAAEWDWYHGVIRVRFAEDHVGTHVRFGGWQLNGRLNEDLIAAVSDDGNDHDSAEFGGVAGDGWYTGRVDGSLANLMVWGNHVFWAGAPESQSYSVLVRGGYENGQYEGPSFRTTLQLGP